MIVSSLLLLALAAGPADASAPPDSAVLLPEVRVEGERIDAARRRLPTASITEVRLDPAHGAPLTLAEALGSVPGLTTVQYGGLGAFSTVSLRGAPPGEVSVFLDGTPITSASQTVVDLSDLPVGALERIEVYRGMFPLGLGAATPGGAINLVTRAAPAAPQASVTRGSFGTWKGALSGGGRRGALAAQVYGDYLGSAGDFRFHDDNGTPFQPADDSISTRVNDRVDEGTLLASASWAPTARARVTLRQNLFRKAMGLPGLAAVQARDAGLGFNRELTHLEAASDGRGPWPDLALRGAVRHERSRFHDLQAQLGVGRHDTDDHFGAEDAAAELGWRHLPLGLALDGAASVHAERADLHDRLSINGDPPPSHRLARGVMAGADWSLAGGRALLHVAQRWDRVADALRSSAVGGVVRASDLERAYRSPQAGLQVRLPLGLAARANWSDSWRVPAFLELFGNQGSVIGNPALLPEHGVDRDAGLAWSGGAAGTGAHAEWSHFANRADDLILYLRASPSAVRAQNVSRARIDGDELSARAVTARGASIDLAMTWQRAVDDGASPVYRGKQLPQRPARQAAVRAEVPLGRWRFRARLDHIAENVLDAYNRYRVPSRTLLGAAAAWEVPSIHLRITLEGENLTDREAADIGGFPLPGRSVFLACETQLGPAGPIRR